MSVEKIEKTKVFIVRDDEVLILTRSQDEETRQGEHDLAGGTHDEGETDPFSVGIREVETEELVGVHLLNMRYLWRRPRMKAGKLVVTHLLAATAELPDGGIQEHHLSDEHTEAQWINRTEFSDLTIPGKYKLAAKLFEPVFADLTGQTATNVIDLEEYRQSQSLAA